MRAFGVPRAEIFLCTKVSHEYLHAGDFARSVDESLKTLGDEEMKLIDALKRPNGRIANPVGRVPPWDV